MSMLNQEHAAAAGDAARARRLSFLSRATREELSVALAEIEQDVGVQPVRGPETGLIMLRGRIGGGGNPFNLGEATVTRAAVQLASGAVGHGQRLGTDREATRLSAVADAVAEDGAHAATIESLLQSVAARIAAERRALAEETEATRVDFFTLVRGED